MESPTFKLQVDYVEVDAVVTDQQGRFVRDLKKEDFQVFEDRKAQTISAFTLVDIPIERSERPLFAAQPIEPDVRTNARPFDGRIYIVVLDDLHVQFRCIRSMVRRVMRKFIQEKLGANDLMAVIHVGRAGRENSQEFTSSKRLLLAAVDKFLGKAERPATVEAYEQYLATVGIAGRRHLRSDGAEARLRRAQHARGAAGDRRLVRQRPRTQEVDPVRQRRDRLRHRGHVQQAGRVDDHRPDARSHPLGDQVERQHLRDRSARADRHGRHRDRAEFRAGRRRDRRRPERPRRVDRAAVQSLGQRGLQNELRLQHNSLRTLAEETGGFAVINTNSFDTTFSRIVEDNSSYYVLAYYPPNPKRDGKFHNIQVRVNRPGADRARAPGLREPDREGEGAGRQPGEPADRRSARRRSTVRCRSAA